MNRDWICKGCTYLNFRSRKSCRGCGIPSTGSRPVIRNTDWSCPNCNTLQYSSIYICRLCGSDRSIQNIPFQHKEWYKNGKVHRKNESPQTNPVPSIPVARTIRSINVPSIPAGRIIQVGDWICPNSRCNDYQFARNVVCRKCQTRRPNNNVKPMQSDGSDESDECDECDECDKCDELICVVCMDAPKEAAFIHSEVKTSHTCCCMACATQIMNTTKKCPMCNIKTKIMVRNFQ